MAKNKKTNDIEVIEPKVVKSKQTKKFLIKVNVGSNPDGSPKFPAGTMQPLTKEQETNFKLNKII